MKTAQQQRQALELRKAGASYLETGEALELRKAGASYLETGEALDVKKTWAFTIVMMAVDNLKGAIREMRPQSAI